jgi:hypothetical protein
VPALSAAMIQQLSSTETVQSKYHVQNVMVAGNPAPRARNVMQLYRQEFHAAVAVPARL